MKNHITFATGKGILIRESSGGRSHESVDAKAGKPAARRLKSTTTTTQAPQAAKFKDTSVLGSSSNTSATANARHESADPLYHFDEVGLSSKFLRLNGPQIIACHTNASQTSQGTAFLQPPIHVGEAVSLRIRCREKPGRMRYFIGCAPSCFDVDAGQALIQSSSYSLENLKASPNLPGRPCTASAPPCFHTGSEVTLKIDLRRPPGVITWQVDSTGVRHTVVVDKDNYELHAFVSLYNRGAIFEVFRSSDTS